MCQTVAALPTFRRRVATADRPPCMAGHRWWPRYRQMPPASTAPDGHIDHPTRRRLDGGHCARQDAANVDRSGGSSTTVTAATKTVVDPPTRHADEMSAERPPSGTFGGRIDHRHRTTSRAERDGPCRP